MISKMQMLHLARSAPSESAEFHMLVKHGLSMCSARTEELLPVPGYAKYSRVQNPETSGTLPSIILEWRRGTNGRNCSIRPVLCGGALE